MTKTPLLNSILFVISLIFAIWFVLTSHFWVYSIALVFSYPFGLFSFLIWLWIKQDGKKRNNAIIIILGIGLLKSLAAFFWLNAKGYIN